MSTPAPIDSAANNDPHASIEGKHATLLVSSCRCRAFEQECGPLG
jgi:hypothetical protein